MLLNRKINQLILGMALYYQLVMNSAWIDLDTNPTWKLIGYVFYGLMLIIIILQAWKREFSVFQIASEALMVVFMGVYLAIGNLSVAIVFLFGIYATFMTTDELLDSYLYALIASVLSVFAASLLNLLPMVQDTTGFWIFGFKNPNMTGYYLAIIVLLLIVKSWGVVDWRIFVAFIFTVIVSGVFLEDWTAVLTLSIGAILWIIGYKYPNFVYMKLPKLLVVISPIILTLMSYFIAWGWAHLTIIQKLNRVFTARPDIWHYYSTFFRAKLVGSNLPSVLTYANGAFDGGFVYYPLTNGILVSLLLGVTLVATLVFLVKQRQTRYLALILVFLAFAFSENPPFFAFQSPLLPMVLALGLPGFSHSPNRNSLSDALDETE